MNGGQTKQSVLLEAALPTRDRGGRHPELFSDFNIAEPFI